jgi:hypothetical protein
MPVRCKFWQFIASKIMKNKECEQNMAKQDLVRDKVEETLASLDRMERLDAGPAFFSKLQARLGAKTEKPVRPGWFRLPKVFAPALRPALLAILVLVNILTVVFVAKTGTQQKEVEKASVMTVAADYSLSQNLDEFNFAGAEVGK